MSGPPQRNRPPELADVWRLRPPHVSPPLHLEFTMSVPGSPQYVFDWYLDLLRKDTLGSDLMNTAYHAIFLVQVAADAIITERERMQIDDVRAALSVRFPFLANRDEFVLRLGSQSPDPVIAKLLWEALHLNGPGPTGLYTLGKPGVLDHWGAYVTTATVTDLEEPPPVPKKPAVPTFEEYFGSTVTDRSWTVAGAAELLEVEARRLGEVVTVMYKGFSLTCGNNITAAYAVMNWYALVIKWSSEAE